MTNSRLIKWQLKDTIKHILFVWAFTILILTSWDWYDRQEIKREIAEIAAESFDDYMVYHSIFPPVNPVSYGDEIWYKSDSEIKKGGFEIIWQETIECDHNPYDGNTVYEFHATVKTTSRKFIKPRPRPDHVKLERMKGFPSVDKDTAKVLTYPHHDADCRLESIMTQKHKHGIIKIQTKYSEPALVRGYE